MYDIQQVHLPTVGECLHHCFFVAPLERKAEWIVDFDIDEIFAFGSPVTTKYCDDDKDYLPEEGLLTKFISQLAQKVLGVVVPRFDFGQNGLQISPSFSSQMELYTRRSDRASNAGKVIRRAYSDGSFVQHSKHSFLAKSRESGIYPNGKPAYLSGNCTDGNSEDMCHLTFSDVDLPVEEHLAFPRMHHYASRSLADCIRKIDRVNSSWYQSQGDSPWRLSNAATVCDESKNMEVEDFSVYCESKKVREELRMLFPSFNTEPCLY